MLTERELAMEFVRTRCDVRLEGSDRERSVKWLTISQGETHFEGMDLRIKVHVTGHASFSAKDCTFRVFSNDQNAIVDVFANSQAHFESCTFIGAPKLAVAVRDCSVATFRNCRWLENTNGVLIANDSRADFENCVFSKSASLSVYAYRGGQAVLSGCRFDRCGGKGVFALTDGMVVADGCAMSDMSGHGVFAARKSLAVVRDCTFERVKGSGVTGCEGASLRIANCRFSEIGGHGVAFKNSSGHVCNVTIANCGRAAIGVAGAQANPVIMDTKISDCKSFGVTVRDFAVPLFQNVTIKRVKMHAFSVSDFAAPLVRGCRIAGAGGVAFSVFNGARLTIQNNTVATCKAVSDTFLEGSLSRARAVFAEPEAVEPAAPSPLARLNVIPVPAFPSSDEPALPGPMKRIDVMNDVHKCGGSGPSGCVQCGRAAAKMCDSCGHRVCEACEDMVSGTHRCPRCSMECERVVRVFEEETCCICLDAAATTIVLPCGHKCMCAECAVKIAAGVAKCPVCNGSADAIKSYVAQAAPAREPEPVGRTEPASGAALRLSSRIASTTVVVCLGAGCHDNQPRRSVSLCAVCA